MKVMGLEAKSQSKLRLVIINIILKNFIKNISMKAMLGKFRSLQFSESLMYLRMFVSDLCLSHGKYVK